jgi:hypothetical protein
MAWVTWGAEPVEGLRTVEREGREDLADKLVKRRRMVRIQIRCFSGLVAAVQLLTRRLFMEVLAVVL